MKIVTETTISSSHHLPDYKGKCHNVHGHNWRIVVMVEGSLQKEGPEKGMVVDFNTIKRILDMYDHKDLNGILANPTAENIALRMCGQIKRECPSNVDKVVVRIFESTRSYVEVDSDEALDSQSDIFEKAKIELDKMDKQREADKDVGQPEVESHGDEEDSHTEESNED